MNDSTSGDLGFSYRVVKSSDLLINRDGKLVTTIRGSKALDMVAKLKFADFAGQQQLLARATGNYKRGNE